MRAKNGNDTKEVDDRIVSLSVVHRECINNLVVLNHVVFENFHDVDQRSLVIIGINRGTEELRHSVLNGYGYANGY